MPRLNYLSTAVIQKNTDTTDLVALLLANRSIKKTEVADFLHPVHPRQLDCRDFGLKKTDLTKIVTRINRAIATKENILIYGDYDVDGITATALLWQALVSRGAQVTPFLPDREADGYGFRYASYRRAVASLDQSFSLIITVDNGIVAHTDIQTALDNQLDVIVVDHHAATAALPAGCLSLHSTLVSGSALSWFLSSQFNTDADLGLAAMGTIADCLPLLGVNRSLVVHGLKALSLNPSIGIKKLIDVSGLKSPLIGTYEVGFVLAPRLNAAGRLANPMDALRLLCAATPAQAAKYAKIVDDFNRDRQTIQQTTIDQVIAQKPDPRNKVIITADSSYHPGIIGLIAGRLTEKYYQPSVVISVGPEIAKGSCRSIPELNIIESLRQVSDLLLDVGGHAGAAGFSIATKNIKKFSHKLTELINTQLKDIVLEPKINIDACLDLNAVTLKNCQAISQLEPFGIANPEPLFLLKSLKIVTKKVLGATGDHLRLNFDDPQTPSIENVSTAAIAFKKGHLDKELKIGDKVDVVARLSVNDWQGTQTPQLMVKEIIRC